MNEVDPVIRDVVAVGAAGTTVRYAALYIFPYPGDTIHTVRSLFDSFRTDNPGTFYPAHSLYAPRTDNGIRCIQGLGSSIVTSSGTCRPVSLPLWLQASTIYARTRTLMTNGRVCARLTMRCRLSCSEPRGTSKWGTVVMNR